MATKQPAAPNASKLSNADRLSLLHAQQTVDLARERRKCAELQAQLTEQSARADHFENQSKLMLEQTRHRVLREAASQVVDSALKAQQELADELAKRYGVDWTCATWSPETGDITHGDLSRSD